MATTFRISAQLKNRIEELSTDIDAERSEMQEYWDARTETWQDSDQGNDVLTWIESLSDLVDALENLDAAP